jgi:flavin-dependent dehydrogenase
MSEMRRVETAVVGGGPAGAAAALGLAAAGREVLLIERADAPHHKVCGEFLSIETQTLLCRLGVDPVALGGVPVDRVSVISAARTVTRALPFHAVSLSRYRLDQAILQRASECGAQVKRGLSVRRAAPYKSGWILRCDDGEMIVCQNFVLATGKWGLRGTTDERVSSQVGLKMHFKPNADVRRALERRVELMLFDRSYVGLELIEGGIANLCLLLPKDVVAQIGPGWPALHNYLANVLPSLDDRLSGAEPLSDKPYAVVCPPRGYLHAEQSPAIYHVGDRLAHIPPFTGDGLAVALASAALAVESIRLGRSPAAYLAAARRLTGHAIQFASAVSAVAGSRSGRRVLMAASTCSPGLIDTIVRQTRVPIAPH